MKVILYMAISVNGYIAKKDDETPWSDEEWGAYQTMVKKIGNVVIGRRTYELMNEDKTLTDLPCSLVVVLTSKEGMKSDDQRVVFVSTFSKAVKTVKSHGFDEVLIGGGGKMNTTALQTGRVNELYLDVEPWLLGEGLILFEKLPSDFKLKLLKTRRIGKNTIQLHYKII